MQITLDPKSWQLFAWQAAVVAALVAAIAALVKGFWALWQQRKELRWKQAELARALTDKWFSWQGSNVALRMVDEGAGSYTVDGYGTSEVYPASDIPRALAVVGSRENWQSVSNTDTDRLIRKSFDVLLYSFERVQHSVQIGVAQREDFAAPAEYYVKQLSRFYFPIATYLEYVGFARAKEFLESFKTWADVGRCGERLATLRARLTPAFAPDTAYSGTVVGGLGSAASAGHCAVVAAIVQAELGGLLLSTHVDGEEHWFNRVSAGNLWFDVDLTGDQFGRAEIQAGLPDQLYPSAVERSLGELQPEARDRAHRLARRAGLRKIAQRLGKR